MASLFTKQFILVLTIFGLLGYSLKLGKDNSTQSKRLSEIEERLIAFQQQSKPNQNSSSHSNVDLAPLQQSLEKIENRLDLLEKKMNTEIPHSAQQLNSVTLEASSEKSLVEKGGGGIEVQLNDGSTLCKENSGSAKCSLDTKTLICPVNTSKKFIREGYSEKYKSKKKIYLCEPI